MDLLDEQLADLPTHFVIVYAVLDWGLGHATRSSVIIRRLLDLGRAVTIASDGFALAYLRRAFPQCTYLTLPAYGVRYTRSATWASLHLLAQTPKVLQAINAEQQLISDYVQRHQVAAIISDNRYGCYYSEVPSYLLTHQLSLPVTGVSGWIANRVLTRWLRKYDAVWVPDDPKVNLSGKLTEHPFVGRTFVGVLSTLVQVPRPSKVDILLALSGPEPQRSMLEETLVQALAGTDKTVLLVRGSRANPSIDIPTSWQVIDLADAQQMSEAMSAAEIVICRSGYSTLMDLYHLGKPAILIPTPGQPEQEYLGHYLADKGIHQFTVVAQKEVSRAILERFIATRD